LRPEDAGSLARHADNRAVWINLRDAFPHPYRLEDAEAFIEASRRAPETRFAIVVDGDAVGAVGLALGTDVERVSAELGYWLGEEYWGRGIMTAVVGAITDYAVREYGLTRVFATPFSWNRASGKVLEKAGYVLEGVLRRSALKDGRIVDKLLYAHVTPDSSAPHPRSTRPVPGV
jgi:RimJ/RimL family protein N-acetyltransferase